MNLGKAFFIIVHAHNDVEEWMGGNHLKGKRWRRQKMYERGNIFLQRSSRGKVTFLTIKLDE